MKNAQRFLLLIIILLSACDKQETGSIIDVNDSLSFNGKFTLMPSFFQNDSVILTIHNNKYECLTGLPFGRGAGKLIINDKRIEFIDTLFFIIPAIYGPSYVLSGEYNYKFDGEKLVIQKDLNDGHKIVYDLQLIESNLAQ
jgi:hypothetical protein